MSTDDALAFAAKCGAACLTGRGPFAGQLVLDASARASSMRQRDNGEERER